MFGIEKEKPFETGMDEQAKQAAMSKLGESVTSLARDNDRSSDYFETVRLSNLVHLEKMRSLELAEREQGLLERKNRESERAILIANREFSTHQANLRLAFNVEAIRAIIIDIFVAKIVTIRIITFNIVKIIQHFIVVNTVISNLLVSEM